MLKGCLGTILIGVIMFIFVIGVILLLAIGLEYVLQIIPCDVLVYIETGVLLGLFMLIGTLLMNPRAVTALLDKYKRNE